MTLLLDTHTLRGSWKTRRNLPIVSVDTAFDDYGVTRLW